MLLSVFNLILIEFFKLLDEGQKKGEGAIYFNLFSCKIEQQLFTELLCHFQYSI